MENKMESNSVILDLETYDRLREFERSIKDGRTLVETTSGFSKLSFFYSYEEIADEHEKLNLEIDRLKSIISELRSKPKKKRFLFF